MEFLQLFNFVKEEDLKPKSEEVLYNEILNKFNFLTTKDLERPRFEDVRNYYNMKEDDPLIYKIYLEICKDKLDDEEREYYENVISELIEIKKQKQEQLLKEYEERKAKVEEVEEVKQDILRNDN
jgi:hypothetical protein